MNVFSCDSLFRRVWAATWLCAFAANALANPTGMTVISGSATPTTSGSQLTITTSQNAYLNWQSFNIAAGETTVFNQPSATSIVWNRINNQNPSQIFGSLQANGIVVLLNSSGFYFGPNSFLSAAGLVISTANYVPPQNGGGGWEFNGPPPLKSIVNYGQIQVGNGGSAFLIADQIKNHGSIEAPGGTVGLAAGQTVLLSERPDGRGMSMQVTLPRGSVDNEGRLIADGGTIAMNARVVNQNGFIQANSVKNVNGTIELVASDQLTLGANSQIIASGDNSPSGSAGGNVTLQSGNNFSDSVGSQIITTGGTQGGNGGNVEISAPNVRSLNSSINARAQTGWTAGKLLLDPDYIILDTSGSGSAGSGTVLAGSNPGGTLDLNVNSAFANLAVSEIILQAAYDITLAGGTSWNLSKTIGANFGGVSSGLLTLEAGRNIIFGDGSKITDANNWSVTLDAGYNFANNTIQSGVGNIYLNGGSGQSGSGSIQLSQGSINLTAGNSIVVGSGCQLIDDGGTIGLYAQTVNQNGLIQADSVGNQHGVIELVASDQLNLGASSQIIANGDNSPDGSAGGQIMLQTAQTFSDDPDSQIQARGGANGGDGGKVLIYAASANSQLDVSAQAGSAAGSIYYYPRVDDLTLNASSLAPFAGFSHVLFQAGGKITINNIWDLSASTGTGDGQLIMEASGNIALNNGSQITDANNWGVTLEAGYDFASHSVDAGSVSSITLNGNSSIQTAAGNLSLVAGKDITVKTGFVRSTGGGNVSAWALAGSVNTGTYAHGYQFLPVDSLDSTYCQIEPINGVGGISTEAGGNVTITAGGDVTSYLPGGKNATTIGGDAGSGAFGPEAGNVTIVAGGNVTGHYVEANGTGAIYAGVKMASGVPVDADGNPVTDGKSYVLNSSTGSAGTSKHKLALSLMAGGWTVGAAQDIYLQEVRNPNGVFNNANKFATPNGEIPSLAYHYFDYALDAYVNLSAGNSVQLGDNSSSLPRSDISVLVPMIYAPILNIVAGAGGVVLNGDSDPYNKLILFPSPQGSLTITTTDGGSLTGNLPLNSDGSPAIFNLIVSDSEQTQFSLNQDIFGLTDHAITPVHYDNPTPIVLDIAGNMDSVLLGAPEAAQITVKGDMINSRFRGMNLSSDPSQSIQVQVRKIDGSLGTATIKPGLTSINVTGDIINRSEFTTAGLSLPNLSLLSQGYPLFVSPLSYDPKTGLYTFTGAVTEQALMALADLTIQKVDAKGQPLFDSQGNPVLQQVNVLDPGVVPGTLGPNAQTLLAAYVSGAATTTVMLAPDLSYLSEAYLGSTLAGHLFYDSTAGKLTFQGAVTDQELLALADLTIQKVDAKGQPLFDSQGNPVLQQVNVLDPSVALGTLGPNARALQAEYALLGPIPTSRDSGYLIGGGGLFNVTARNMDLGTTLGIVSLGVSFDTVTTPDGTIYPLAEYFTQGADINVTTTGNLDMFSTSISAVNGSDVSIHAGGNVNAGSADFSVNTAAVRGIYSTDQGNVYVYAGGDIDINGSRIAVYDTRQDNSSATPGGSVTVVSGGNIDAGNGGSGFVVVGSFLVNPDHSVTPFTSTIPGSGIMEVSYTRNGNILIEAPYGTVKAAAGGIIQLLLKGNPLPADTTLFQVPINQADLAKMLDLALTGKRNAALALQEKLNGNPGDCAVDVFAGYELQQLAVSLTPAEVLAGDTLQKIPDSLQAVVDKNGNWIELSDSLTKAEVKAGDTLQKLPADLQFVVDKDGYPVVTALNLSDGIQVKTSDNQYVDAKGSGVIGAGTLTVKSSGDVSGNLFTFGDLNVIGANTVDVNAFSGGKADVSGNSLGDSKIFSIGGIDANGDSSNASLFSNDQISGGQNSLAAGTAADAASQGASQESASPAKTDETTVADDDVKKKGKAVATVQKTGRVTVLLPPKHLSQNQTSSNHL